MYKSSWVNMAPSKLTIDDVHNIRSAAVQRQNLEKYIAENLSSTALARKYRVNRSTIVRVVSRVNWADVT